MFKVDRRCCSTRTSTRSSIAVDTGAPWAEPPKTFSFATNDAMLYQAFRIINQQGDPTAAPKPTTSKRKISICLVLKTKMLVEATQVLLYQEGRLREGEKSYECRQVKIVRKAPRL